MQNPLKRWDVLLTLVMCVLMIPSERYEIFSLVEDQTIAARHIMRNYLPDANERVIRDDIIVVALDEDLYEEYGSFPFRRTDLGTLAHKLSTIGARVVVLDFLMDFRSSYQEDEPTAALFEASDNVLLVSYAQFDGEYAGITYPTEKLRAVTRSGYGNVEPTSAVIDNVARLRIHERLTVNVDGWPLAIQALAMYWDVSPRLEDDVLYFGSKIEVPLDQFGDIYIDFPMLDSGTQYLSEGRAGYSALEILDLDLETLPEDELEEYRSIFEDRIVLVGDTWEVTHDKFNTPVGQVYGVEIIANTINTIMNDAPLRPSGWFLEISSMTIFLSVLLATSLIPAMALRLLAVVGAYVTYIVIAGSLYVYAGSVLSMSYAILTGFMVVIFASIRRYMVTEEKEKLSTADSVESN